MARHHIIISGTGRAGTTFLVQLLTELGLDTGFPKGQKIDQNSSAGLELDLRSARAPYIIKSPWLCDYLDEVLQGGELIIDCALIPMRDLYSAAESRRVLPIFPTQTPPVYQVVFGTQQNRRIKRKSWKGNYISLSMQLRNMMFL